MRVSLSAYDAQGPSIKDTLDFLTRGPAQIAGVRLLERGDSNTVVQQQGRRIGNRTRILRRKRRRPSLDLESRGGERNR